MIGVGGGLTSVAIVSRPRRTGLAAGRPNSGVMSVPARDPSDGSGASGRMITVKPLLAKRTSPVSSRSRPSAIGVVMRSSG